MGAWWVKLKTSVRPTSTDSPRPGRFSRTWAARANGTHTRANAVSTIGPCTHFARRVGDATEAAIATVASAAEGAPGPVRWPAMAPTAGTVVRGAAHHTGPGGTTLATKRETPAARGHL